MSVKSPCIEICKFDGRSGYCVGCVRTRDECRGWNKMKDNRRHQILHDRARRETKLPKPVPDDPH
ncbi:MAG: DUF1289 domain-containing protein [Pseudomonadota bacterium]|nr:DUF1289 domain-containing protein [Pseudomonadota bacterium]